LARVHHDTVVVALASATMRATRRPRHILLRRHWAELDSTAFQERAYRRPS
jgi:hypothetical protein